MCTPIILLDQAQYMAKSPMAQNQRTWDSSDQMYCKDINQGTGWLLACESRRCRVNSNVYMWVYPNKSSRIGEPVMDMNGIGSQLGFKAIPAPSYFKIDKLY